MNYVLKTFNLSKSIKNKTVINKLNLNVKKGEIYALVGPNNSGKTVLMKLLTNLMKASEGEIELFGEKLTNHSYELLKRVGSIIDYPVFYEDLSPRENLELHCKYMGYYNIDDIDNALDLVNLKNIDDSQTNQLSLGTRQRLAIARAIITKPELLILDEPISGLDPVEIKEIRNLFKMINELYGITLLISFHVLSEVEHIADTIGILTKGTIVKELPMKSIQEESREYLEIECDDINKASFILSNNLGISNFKILEDKSIRIYDLSKSRGEISKALILNDVLINTLYMKKNSLEDYFLKTINNGDI